MNNMNTILSIDVQMSNSENKFHEMLPGSSSSNIVFITIILNLRAPLSNQKSEDKKLDFEQSKKLWMTAI